MLVDSSVWVNYLRGQRDPRTLFLLESLRSEQKIWMVPAILQEVLQGAGNELQFMAWSRQFQNFPWLDETDPRLLAREAAHLYARCRWAGVTPRSPNDCLIAQYAIRFDVPILHNDQDFPRIAKVEPKLKLLP